MTTRKAPLDPAKRDEILKKIVHDATARKNGYRDTALRIFPHICGRCGREFSGRKLVQLTVHHKDGNHNHNPPDGSNWELLCIYCHDNEHEVRTESYFAGKKDEPLPSIFTPFEGLDSLIKIEGEEPDSEKDKDKI
jgi:5-methylcytosine-specific restriction endonuclease McrA